MRKVMKTVAGLMCMILCLGLLFAGCSNNVPVQESPSEAPSAAQTASEAPSAEPTPTPDPVKVNVGIHGNGGGASLLAVGVEQGFFAEYGIDPVYTLVESGPVEMAAMRADTPTLDIGYIGPGVAWNPVDSTGNSLSFVFFDNLGNSERLLAKKGLFTDSNGNGTYDSDELYAGLKGKTVYFEVGTTPGGWFKNLLLAVNDGHTAEEQLWIDCEDAAYLEGYEAPNKDDANRVQVVNYQNANIPAGMAASGSDKVEIAVGYEPVPNTVVSSGSDVEIVADINSLSSDKIFPSTYVANTKWLIDNPEVAQNFMNVLYKAAIWRAENPDEAMRMSEKICQKPTDTFSAGSYIFPTKEEFKEWFAAADSKGYTLLNALYNERVPNIPEGTTPKSFEDSIDFSFMLNAIAEIE